MLRLLQLIFSGDTHKSYPESLVKEAIERAVDGTDPWIRAVSGYKKKLRPAILHAIDHVVALVDALPPPLPVSLRCYGEDKKLKAFFISTVDMKKIIRVDRSLGEFLRGPEGTAPQVTALLAMEKQEKMIFGAELSGDIVIRDVPQVAVSFDAHRLIDPAGNEKDTRRYLKRRAFDHLLSLALKRLTTVKSEREDLERRRELLQAKLNLLERWGWGFDEPGSAEILDVAGVEKSLGQIEEHLLKLGGNDRMLEKNLEIVTDVLGRSEDYIWATNETISVNRMGIKRGEAAIDTSELTFNEFSDIEGQSLVIMLVAFQADDLQFFSV